MATRVEHVEQLSDALALEEIAFRRSITDAVTETDAAVKALERELAKKGLLTSPGRHVQELEIRFSGLDGVIEKTIRKRKELGRRCPDLLTQGRLAQLRDRLNHHVDTMLDGLKTRNAMGGHGYGAVPASVNQQMPMKGLGIKARIAQDLEALRLEARLGIQEEKPVTIFNISGSTIAGLNLGTVLGDLNASVQILNNQGRKEFADAIQALAEALAASADLQEAQRRELLEHLSVVSTEVTHPPETRKMGPLKSSIAALREGIAQLAQLAGLWSTVEQILKTTGILS
jgi:hypothetical protein